MLKGYLEQQGFKKFGPNWQEERAAKRAALANMPSPTEARAQRAATLESTQSLAPYREAQGTALADRTELARLAMEHKQAVDALALDPENPANKLRAAQTQKALADASLSAAKATNPAAFRAAGGAHSRGPGIKMSGEGGKPVVWYPQTQEVISAPEGVGLPDTSDMRNKVAGRQLATVSIQAVKALSQNIITKVGPAQRAQAMVRGAEAVFGNDPAFRTYQDARMALAGNLAVAQQGSRPSDADIKAIWLPLVPDAFRDTSESNTMKWNLIETMMGVGTGGQGEQGMAPAGAPAPPAVPAAPAPLGPAPSTAPTIEEWVRGPNGQLVRRK